MSKTILEVRGIGPSTATMLAENGIVTAADLAAKKVSQVASIKGFSEIRATQVIADAKALVAPGQTKENKKAKTAKKVVSKKKISKKATKKTKGKVDKKEKKAAKNKKKAKGKKGKKSTKKAKK